MFIPSISRRKTSKEPFAVKKGGEFWVDRISGAARNMPWQVTLLKLAWTAGPATFLAASIGYYLGYGIAPPLQNLRFFLFYTIVSGLIGIGASIVANATYGQRRKKAEEELLEVVDRLPDLIAAVRNLQLIALDPDLRRLEAAGFLLQRVDLEPASLTLAMRDLGASQALAIIAAKIDAYRIAGLYSRIDELVLEAEPLAQPVIEAVAEWAPRVAKLLRLRLQGLAPSFNEGIPRDSNFLERTLTAAEQDNIQILTLHDVEEMLILVCELINGRSIPLLLLTYRGHTELNEATALLEQRRNAFRLARASILSRLKALAEHFDESSESGSEISISGVDSNELIQKAIIGLHRCNDTIEAFQRMNRPDWESRRKYINAINTLEAAMKLIKAMHRVAKHAERRHTIFLRTVEKWKRIMSKHKVKGLSLPDHRQEGLQVEEIRIELNDDARIELAKDINQIFRDNGIQIQSDRIICSHGTRKQPLDSTVAKSIALGMASALQPFVDITRPEIQRAIDASNAANLMGIESGLSARAKAVRSAAAAQEVEDNMAYSAERLASYLVTHYGIALDEDIIEFLNSRYGASIDHLQTLSALTSEQVSTDNSTITKPFSPVSERPEWGVEVKRAEKLLSNYSRRRY